MTTAYASSCFTFKMGGNTMKVEDYDPRTSHVEKTKKVPFNQYKIRSYSHIYKGKTVHLWLSKMMSPPPPPISLTAD